MGEPDSSTKCTLKIWVGSDNSAPTFELRVFEDQADDWPYPHEMSYTVEGTLPSSIYDGSGTISKFIYQTLVEDDLMPFIIDKETFIVTSSDVTETTIGPNSTEKTVHLHVPRDFLYISLEKTNEQQITLKWRRFYIKWEVDTQGHDVLRNAMEQTILFTETTFRKTKQTESEMKTRLHRCTIM